MFPQPLFVGALNHLLASANWARARLSPFAGRVAAIDLPPFRFALAVEESGLFAPGDIAAPADVTIRLPADMPLKLMRGLDRAFAAAHVEGNAEFATELSFVLRHLRWDVEEDLSRLVGDIAAHRLVAAGDRFLSRQREAAGRLGANLAEYLRDERRLFVSREDLATFAAEVSRLADDLAALEKRLARAV